MAFIFNTPISLQTSSPFHLKMLTIRPKILPLYCISCFIEFIGMTLVNKTIEVSSVQFKTSAHLHPLPQAESLSVPTYTLFASPHPFFSLDVAILLCRCMCLSYMYFCLIPSTFLPSPLNSLLPDCCESVSVSIFLFLFYLLNLVH